MSYSELPTYNLKAVVAETGLKPDTIRAWERRYGLPVPPRTAGGHRLYSERDIATLQWLTARKRDGMSISTAVGLWRRKHESGEDPLVDLAQPPPRTPEPLRSGATLEEAHKRWVEACLAYDEAGAERIVAESFAAFPVEAVCFSVLRAGLTDIGARWHANQVSVQQEHFASALAVRRVEALLASAPSPQRADRIIIGCAAGETHVFAALLLTLLLRRRGWQVVYLGANVPQAQLEAAVEQVDPWVVILIAQLIQSAATLQEMGFLLQRAGVRMAYGGLIFNRVPELRLRIPGEFLGERLEQATEQLERMQDSAPSAPRLPDRSPAEQAALDHFRGRQADLNARLSSALAGSGIGPADLQTANHFFGQGIAAALSLGDLAFLGEDLRWVSELLDNYGSNHGSLSLYLQAYLQAVCEVLDGRAAPITSWLERQVRTFVGSE